MATTATVPIERTEIDTPDLGLAHELLSRRYVDHRTHLLGTAPNFMFRSRSARVGDLTIDTLTHTAPVRTDTDASASCAVILTLRNGRLVCGQNREEHRLTCGDTLLIGHGGRRFATWDRMDCQIIQLPYTELTRVAHRLGVEPVDLRFDGAAPISAAMNRHWLSTAAYVARSFAGPTPAITHPLLLATTLQNVAATVLAVFPNTAMGVDYLAGPGRVAPAAVRRAVAYIDAHADRPITLHDVADTAGVGVRALQAAFARHRGTSPSGYLRRVRMERAHRELQTGARERGDTVAAIARRWGFTSPGRFAADYRALFGQPPSHTLRT